MQLANMLVRIRGASALKDPEVATALKLTDTQQVRIKDVTRRIRTSQRDRFRKLRLGRKRRASLRESLRELSKESEQQVIAMLNADQRQKFEQLRSEVRN